MSKEPDRPGGSRQVRWRGLAGTIVTFLLLAVLGEGDGLQVIVDFLLPPENAFGAAVIQLSPVFDESASLVGESQELLLLIHDAGDVHETSILRLERVDKRPAVAVGSLGMAVAASIPPRTQVVPVPLTTVKLPPDTLAAINLEPSDTGHLRGVDYRFQAGTVEGPFAAQSLILSTPNDHRRQLLGWFSLVLLVALISSTATGFRRLKLPDPAPTGGKEDSAEADTDDRLDGSKQ